MNSVDLQGLMDTIQFRGQLSRQVAHKRQLDRCLKMPQCDKKKRVNDGFELQRNNKAAKKHPCLEVVVHNPHVRTPTMLRRHHDRYFLVLEVPTAIISGLGLVWPYHVEKVIVLSKTKRISLMPFLVTPYLQLRVSLHPCDLQV